MSQISIPKRELTRIETSPSFTLSCSNGLGLSRLECGGGISQIMMITKFSVKSKLSLETPSIIKCVAHVLSARIFFIEVFKDGRQFRLYARRPVYQTRAARIARTTLIKCRPNDLPMVIDNADTKRLLQANVVIKANTSLDDIIYNSNAALH